MIERRKFVRIESSIKVTYRILEKAAQDKAAISRNISAGGIRMIFGEYIEPGAKLELKVFLPNELKPLTVIGEVVWQSSIKGASGNMMDTGIKYIKAEGPEILKITSYVMNKLRKDLTKHKDSSLKDVKLSGSISKFLSRDITDLKGVKNTPEPESEVPLPDGLVDEINLPFDCIRYAYVKSSLSIKFRMLDGTKFERKSLSQYISGGGVWLLSDKELPKDTLIELTIELPGSKDPIIVMAKVADFRVTTRYGDKGAITYYETNAKFVSICPNERKKIIRFVYACRSDFMLLGKKPPPGWLDMIDEK
ncbi:MAG: PilZ domain-containing protein [Candidatus Omnitrophota bacterium]